MTGSKSAVALASGEGRSFAAGLSAVTVKAGVAETGGTLSVLEYTAGPGFGGPGKHVHPGFDECFYVLEGRGRFQAGDESVDLEAGGSLFVPGDLPHGFANPWDEPLKFLVVCRPGGFENFVAEAAGGFADGSVADPDFMPALWERYGMASAV